MPARLDYTRTLTLWQGIFLRLQPQRIMIFPAFSALFAVPVVPFFQYSQTGLDTDEALQKKLHPGTSLKIA